MHHHPSLGHGFGATRSPTTRKLDRRKQRTANGGPAVRQAAAAAYQALLGLASTNLGVPVGNLTVTNGVVSGGGKTVSYAALVGGNLLQYQDHWSRAVEEPQPVHRRAGPGCRRFDIPDIVTGAKTYIQNVRIPGMLHGRVVRPRGQANIFGQTPQGTPANFTLLSVDPSSIKDLPDVQIVQKGNFLGVVAPLEYDAIQAAAPAEGDLGRGRFPPRKRRPLRGDSLGSDPRCAGAQLRERRCCVRRAAKVISATYEFPFQMHGPIGPTAAVADVTPHERDGVRTRTGWLGHRARWPGHRAACEQHPDHLLRGASVFNTSPNLPVIADAAIMSQAVGKPVRVQYMRWDSHGWEMYGQANLADIRGGLDANGKLIAYDHISWLDTQQLPQPRTDPDRHDPAARRRDDRQLGARGTGPERSHDEQPAERRCSNRDVQHGRPVLPEHPQPARDRQDLPSIFYTCPLRAPDCIQPAWSSESMIDELAHAANTDAYQFRLGMTTHPGWLGVLNAVAQASNWQTRVSASNLGKGPIVSGRGIAIAGENHASADVYAGVVAEVQVNLKTGKIVVTHLYGAQDSGVIVNPASVENQMTGMLVRGAGRTLIEAVGFSKQRVTGLDWVSYPMLRFGDHPAVTTIAIGHPNETATAATSPQGLAGPRYRGAGESLEAPVPAAIGNAFFDATGVRMRQIPLTPAKVRAALKVAGIS